jgi:creatinine amidohydrolase/Fe(II)-dependent formamide hydrolase-like protein
LPKGVRAYVINYWDGMAPDAAGEFMGGDEGLHANKGEISGVMAVNPDYVDMDAATSEMPPFPEVGNVAAVHTAFFFSSPGSVYRATHSGAWGDAREASVEFGERYLTAVVDGTVKLLDDIERTQAAMPDRP